ncbi:MAG: hypothetical protein QOH04_693 [Sphingomonadales bacterium]|nr:hypothetical protein [Sphingomonadales bacterium]
MLRKFCLLLGLALMPALAAAQAPRTVTLGRGDSIVVHIAPDGAVSAGAAAVAAPISDFEAAALAQMNATTLVEDAKVQPPIPLDRGRATRPSVQPGQVRITLRALAPSSARPNGEMMLSLENGYDGALRYRAALRNGDRSMPTDVCIVLPHKFGFEHLPYPYERVEISELRVIPWHEGDAVTCE